AQAVLNALLPEIGTDIKGKTRSEADLRKTSGYAKRPRDYDDLIRILDAELRLITPTDLDSSPGESRLAESSERYYQLTHDYLVPSLRLWLTSKQRETRRGRAALLLDEHLSAWRRERNPKYLPGINDLLYILIFKNYKERSIEHNDMLINSASYL